MVNRLHKTWFSYYLVQFFSEITQLDFSEISLFIWHLIGEFKYRFAYLFTVVHTITIESKITVDIYFSVSWRQNKFSSIILEKKKNRFLHPQSAKSRSGFHFKMDEDKPFGQLLFLLQSMAKHLLEVQSCTRESVPDVFPPKQSVEVWVRETAKLQKYVKCWMM